VAAVRPVANAQDSTAEVYLADAGLPDLDRWPAQLARWANASYDFRGVEVTLAGAVTGEGGVMRLTVPGVAEPITLLPLEPGTELAWDLKAGRPRPATAAERDAYRNLFQATREHGTGLPARLTGPLRRTPAGWSLLVRLVGLEPACR
jgi:hypothetical protein